MSVPAVPIDCLRFDRCVVHVVERRLEIDGAVVPLGGRAFDVLLCLLEHRDRLVPKAELLDTVWPGLFVEENNLPTQIGTLRKALGAHVITTIPGRGYRFSARVSTDAPVAPAATVDDSGAGAVRLKTNLPDLLPPLIGRAADLAIVDDLVERCHVVTLAGGGGVGKTRLAQAVASSRRHAYRHGICWVSLGSVSHADALPVAMADALGVPLAAGPPLQALLAALAPLDLLLFLDNAEHLLEAVARIVEALRVAAPGLRFVLTSQMPLKITGEHVHAVRGLEVPPSTCQAADAATRYGAVELFVVRAAAADSRFSLDDTNTTVVVAICRSLDGLALAIELAAARVRTLGLARLARSLDDRLRLLKQPATQESPSRQQTLGAALDWSHSFLTNATQVVFRRLAVLAGSASLELAQAIVADPDPDPDGGSGEIDGWQAIDALSELVDRSFVDLVADDANESLPRYRLLDSPRLYALDRLNQSGEADLIRARHCAATSAIFAAADIARWDGSLKVV